MKITASNIVNAIAKLPKDRAYDYVNPKSPTKILIDNVQMPEGPITIKRYRPSKGENPSTAKKVTISMRMIWRIANAINTGQPVNFDRVLGGSYNTRSALEALLAHTPEFYYSYPGRIEVINSSTKIKKGHKHLIWRPDDPHQKGLIEEAEAGMVISELPTSAVYEALILPAPPEPGKKIDIEVQRRHAQIQVALILIGQKLKFRIWVAQNDKGIIYNGVRIGEMTSVVPALEDERILQAYEKARKAAMLIDCIWFQNERFMPAVFEIEHTTGVRSGLVRMKGLQDAIPPIQTRWVIVAPDEARDKVLKEANMEQFSSLDAQFLPYSGVEELYSLAQRNRLMGVSDKFLDGFIEPCLN